MIPHPDLKVLLETVGYIGLFAIVFAESGLFFGFFLPGDSLLFTAGLLAAAGHFKLSIVIILSLIAAILGDSFGYYFGSKTGKLLFKKEDSLIFNKNNLEKSQAFYAAHGAKTIILARFIPVVRTFAPILAGTSHMPYPKFLAYNVMGGFIWVLSLTLLGALLGNTIPNIDHYILPIAFSIIVISLLPIGWKIIKETIHERKIKK
jgi:membrane-associated protein